MKAGAPFIASRWNYLADHVHDVQGLLSQFVEATPVGILVVDHAGSIIFANQSLCSCFGYESHELLGQRIEILVPKALQTVHVQLRDAFLSQPMQRMMTGREVRGRRKDGTEITVAIGLNPMLSDGVVHVACTVMDYSPLQHAENTLLRFFDLSLDLFCIAGTNGYFLRINPNFTRILGYSEQELLQRPFVDFVHPDDVAATQAAVASLNVGEPVVQFRNRYQTLEGTYRWIEWNARAIPQEGTIFAVGRDVTDQVKFDLELQVREQRERAILENTPAVVYLKDIQGRYLYVNQRYSDLFSLDRTSLIGRTDYEIFPAELAKRFVDNDRHVLNSRKRITVRETAPHPEGLHTYVSVKFPLLDIEGEVAAVAGISTDITEHLKAQEIQDQLKLATIFQQKLFPEQAPSIAGLDLYGAAAPVTQLCGDYFDFIVTAPGRVTIVVGDVSGHGIGPALAMVEVRSILRGLLHDQSNGGFADILCKLNQLLVQDLPDGTFVSLFLAEIDMVRRQLIYAGAGHDALLFHPGRDWTHLRSTGPIVGLMNCVQFENVAPIPIHEGELLLICTDGVIEAMNQPRELFGRQRLGACIAQHHTLPSRKIIEHVFAQVLEFAAGQPIADDMTAVAAKLLPQQGRASWRNS